MDFEERTRLLLGQDAVNKLNDACVCVFGAGGVGSYVIEALVRAGIGTLIVADNDTVSISNINRQLIALHSTAGMAKVDAVRARCLDINPSLNIHTFREFILPANCAAFFDALPVRPDYVCDCIDTISGKLAIISYCHDHGIPVLSCMGTGNKLHPERFRISDISKTSVCPLCRVMRKELKSLGINGIPVLWSDEVPAVTGHTVASVSFVPSVAGLMIAGEVIRQLTKVSS